MAPLSAPGIAVGDDNDCIHTALSIRTKGDSVPCSLCHILKCCFLIFLVQPPNAKVCSPCVSVQFIHEPRALCEEEEVLCVDGVNEEHKKSKWRSYVRREEAVPYLLQTERRHRGHNDAARPWQAIKYGALELRKPELASARRGQHGRVLCHLQAL